MNVLHRGLTIGSGLILCAQLLSTSAAAATNTGTLTGTITCGPARDTRPASARIAVEGTLLSTHTDSVGSFKLEGVPAFQSLTVDAQRDTLASAIASRPNVAVHPGETLDLGILDVGACPAPTDFTPVVNQDETLVTAPDTSNDYYSER